MPTTPQKVAGFRIEPDVSPPVATVSRPAASAAADPLLDPPGVRDKFHEAFHGMWSGSVETDNLNRLVLAAGLSAREITVLRAYTRYLTQAGSTFSRSTYPSPGTYVGSILTGSSLLLQEARLLANPPPSWRQRPRSAG